MWVRGLDPTPEYPRRGDASARVPGVEVPVGVGQRNGCGDTVGGDGGPAKRVDPFHVK